MTRRDLPRYVYPRTARGKTYYRFIRGSVSQQVNPSAPDFWSAYAKLMEGEQIRVPQKQTFTRLIASYKLSSRYTKLAPRTKKDYERVFVRIEKMMGNKNPANVKKSHVFDWQEALDGRFASYFVQVLSLLMKHACNRGWREHNPCLEVELKETTRKAEHIPWTDEALSKWRAEASPLCRLILEVGLGTVQRPDDWTRFNWEDFDGAKISLVQQKTGTPLTIPLLPATIAVLEQHRPRVMNLNGKTPILAIGRQRLTYDRMAHLMLAERRRLGVERHDLHALRYRGVMELAFSGCDDDQIGSISGHMSKDMIKKYAGEARQIMLARAAIAKRAEAAERIEAKP